MNGEHALITTVVGGIVFAFILGYLCKLIRVPAIVGYLLAGIIIGPHTPGFIGDIQVATQLAEIGIILLMFGVGLHFSIKDLLSVRFVAIPGAIFQIGAATIMGAGYAIWAFDLGVFEAIGFGLALSVASTVVLLRTLEARNLITTQVGKVAVGWLIVEDVVMVLAIVFLPVIASMISNAGHVDWFETGIDVSFVVVKIMLFVIAMVLVGRRILPALLVQIAKTKSRELMSLGTLAIALGFAYVAYSMFGASFALGAFLAGLVLNESEIGHRSAEASLPLRDTFSVLFFVSVGMLFDPTILVSAPFAVLAVVSIIIIGKSLAALVITGLFKQTMRVSLIVAVSLAQIGEFSFILAGMARAYEIMPQVLYDLIIAGAILSIGLNPLLFKMVEEYIQRREARQLNH